MKTIKQAFTLALVATLIANARGQPAFTEIINPRNQSGAGFGWSFGGLPDLTRDGIGEFYVVERGRVYVYDGVGLQPIYWIDSSCGGDIGHPTHSAGDLNEDGVPELMVGQICADQFGQVVIIDGSTGTTLFTVNSPNPISLGFFGNTLRLLPDVTGDGRADWLIHQLEAGRSPPAGRAYLFNSQTREMVRSFQNTEAAYQILMAQMEVIPDVDGDGTPELLSGGNARAVVRSMQTGQALYELARPDSAVGVGQAKRAIGDITGDGIGDVATGNGFADNNSGAIFFFNGANGHWLRTIRSPNPRPGGRFGRAIEVLPDLNGDGVPELWTQEDGVQLTYIFDGATSALLKTIPYPGVFDTLFFTSVVRQQAAPGVRGYLFASEFVHNAEGRVYFMPFTPIQPTQLKVIRQATSGLRIRVSGEPGLGLELQATSDWKAWERITTLITTNQSIEIDDANIANQPQRFYRTVQRK